MPKQTRVFTLAEIVIILIVIGFLGILIITLAPKAGADRGNIRPRSEAFALPEAPSGISNSYPTGTFPFQSTPRIVVPIPFVGDSTDDGTVG